MIAIVDDDSGVRVALERLVRSLCRNASAFRSAEEFLQFANLHDTSCLITDVQMPGLSALTCKTVLLAQGHGIPIIFVTGHPDETVRARAMKAGAVAFLEKPVDSRRLIGWHREVLQAA
jgi:FixJ family two-component response regulator